MTNGEQTNERDPLLVRPFVLRDQGSLGGDDATQTWPASATPPRPTVVGSGADDAPTAIMHLPVAGKQAPGRRRKRLVVLAGGATAVVLGAAAAGFAALRDDVRPMVSTGLPGGPVPAATGPLVTGSLAASTPAAGLPDVEDPDGDEDQTGTGNTDGGATPTKRAASGKPTGATPSAGQPIALTPTPGKTTTQPPASPSERVGVIRGQNSLCLDLNGGLTFDYNHIQVARCNDTGAQTWTLATDGTLRVLGKCATSFRDGAVRILRCDDREAARWRRDGQRLINASSDDCLTDPSGGRRAGSGVRVTDCDGSTTQSWSIP
ncbi:RICIN domain-containing protein [Actinoplanes solisilvae]|uniref:RICIN domain-containing protein n=1 Tax=Actinoplanes solisilvae TaxID=2486853 RepID=UPI0013E3EC38|nr:RICIN domain-containing protein [Actinoplanes solisilvae]